MSSIQLDTPHYHLRTMEESDAPALFRCYGDPSAVRLMNDDNCNSGFFMPDEETVRRSIRIWRDDPYILRLAIVDRAQNETIGTMEYCLRPDHVLVLRLDLCIVHEKTEQIAELLAVLCEDGFSRYPAAERIITKAIPEASARREALKQAGFGNEEEYLGHPHYFSCKRPFRGMGYCGLVCGLCSDRAGCAGCKQGGCPERHSCRPYLCGTEKGYDGCGDCPSFPCSGCILDNLRIRTFAAYAHEHGEDALLGHLYRKQAQGVRYHRSGHTGDYDGFDSAEALIRFLES